MRIFFESVADDAMKLISSIHWYDIIDIAIVAFVLYYFIKLVRQTRAFHLVKGIVFLAIVYFVISAMNLSATSYIFSRIFNNFVLVLVLLFQPEIRHAIESFGRGDFKKFSIFNLSKSSDMSNEALHNSASNIAKAAANMSEKKIGALIVVEGKTMLGEIISTGSPVDAKITTTVIENIFFPKAPLHDGAMIIRDNRINCAGCILPLTQNEISKELGTRHRAAMGMSEHSDALVIVVSEETGSISIAQNGHLERDLTLGELLENLNDFLLIDDNEKKKSIRIHRRKK